MNLILLDLIYYTVTVTPDIQQNYHSFILCMLTTQRSYYSLHVIQDMKHSTYSIVMASGFWV